MLGPPLFTTYLLTLAFQVANTTGGTSSAATSPGTSPGLPPTICVDEASLYACTTQLNACEEQRQALDGAVGELESNLAALRNQKKQVDDSLSALRGIVREHLGATTPDGVKAKLQSLSADRDDAQRRASEASKGLKKAQSARRTATRRLEDARSNVRRIEEKLRYADPEGDEHERLQKQFAAAKRSEAEWVSRSIRTADDLEQAQRAATESQHVLGQKLSSQHREHIRELDNLARRADGGSRFRRMRSTIDTALAISIATIALMGCWLVIRRGLNNSSSADAKRDALMEAIRERRTAWSPSPVEFAAVDGWARSVVLAEAARDAVEKLVRASAVGAAGVVLIALGYLMLNGGTPETIGALVETKLWKIIVGFFGPPAAAITAWTTVQQRVREFSELCKQLGLLDSPRGNNADVQST